jgi:glycosyltransferase involved in cell wall biosynthesis
MKRSKEEKRELKSDLKIAVVTDPLIKYESWHEQLKCILKIFPNSTLLTPYYKPEYIEENFPNKKIRDTFLQLILPENNGKEGWLKWERIAYRTLKLRNYDVVISISARCAHLIRTKKGLKHIAIILKPHELFSSARLREKSERTVEKLDGVIANSNSDKRKIRRLYNTNSELIYPPIEVEKFKPENILHRKESWFLTSSNISNRSLRLVIRAAVQANQPLKIVGPLREGLDAEQLIRDLNARGTVKFLGEIPEDAKIQLMQRCRAYIYPVKSRAFGRVAVEANAAGTPVIAYRRGSVIETVSTEHPKTGVFFKKYNRNSLAKVLKSFNDKEFDSKSCIMKAEEFDQSIFMYKLKNYVEDIVQSD